MKIQKPATYREEYAAKAGAIIQSPGATLPGWDAILDEGEELLWQGKSQPRAKASKFRIPGIFAGGIGALIGINMVFWGDDALSGRLLGLLLVMGGLWLCLPPEYRPFQRRRGSFYSLSNRRAFRGETSRSGRLRLVSWPVTPDTSFRLIRDTPPSIRFCEGRLESGRRPRYHEAFEAIADAPEVYKLLLRIQKDAA